MNSTPNSRWYSSTWSRTLHDRPGPALIPPMPAARAINSVARFSPTRYETAPMREPPNRITRAPSSRISGFLSAGLRPGSRSVIPASRRIQTAISPASADSSCSGSEFRSCCAARRCKSSQRGWVLARSNIAPRARARITVAASGKAKAGVSRRGALWNACAWNTLLRKASGA